MRLGVVLFNLGGPDSLEAVEPFLINLFSDKAIIGLPGLFRRPLARLIARRRKTYAQSIYASIGGRSPIVPETEAQAKALEAALGARGIEAKVVIAMRYWTPRAEEAAAMLKAWGAERIALLPLYPQFSTTTTQSSLAEWAEAAAAAGLKAPSAGICCYPTQGRFVEAYVTVLREALARVPAGARPRILFSAHGLPERTVKRGDPYPMQVEATAKAVMEALGGAQDWRVTYQSRVGPLKWIGPDTDAEIEAAAKEKLVPVVVPVSFVSEHSETLYELDQIYRDLALEAGAPAYVRVPAVGTQPAFIEGLADLAMLAARKDGVAPDPSWTGCKGAARCGCWTRS
jgi:protoporphyrin/coproporphyrin ferrochelatase